VSKGALLFAFLFFLSSLDSVAGSETNNAFISILSLLITHRDGPLVLTTPAARGIVGGFTVQRKERAPVATVFLPPPALPHLSALATPVLSHLPYPPLADASCTQLGPSFLQRSRCTSAIATGPPHEEWPMEIKRC
jgi:hypothetical protein